MQVELIFTGLMMFVLGGNAYNAGSCDPNGDGNPHPLNVVMLGGSQAEPHVPRLMVKTVYVKDKDNNDVTSDADEVLSMPEIDPQHAGYYKMTNFSVWYLAGRRLTLPGLGPILLGKGQRQRSATAPPKWTSPTPGSKTGPNSPEHFSWIADLQEACPAGGKFDPSCMQDPAPSSCNVSARAELTYTTSASAPATPTPPCAKATLTPLIYWGENSRKFNFSNGKVYNQALADGADISATCGSVLKIVLKALDGSADRTILVKASSGLPPTVWVFNNPTATPPQTLTNDAPHFSMYFDQLQNKNVGCQIPSTHSTSSTVKCAICSTCDD